VAEQTRQEWWVRRPVAAAALLGIVLALHGARMVPEASNSPDHHDGVELRRGPGSPPARFLGGAARLGPHTQLVVAAPAGAASVRLHGRLTRTDSASSVRFGLEDDEGAGTSFLVPVEPERPELGTTVQSGPHGRVDQQSLAGGTLSGGDALEIELGADGSFRLREGGEAAQGAAVERPARLIVAPSTRGLELSGVEWFDAAGGTLQQRHFKASSPFNGRSSAGDVVRLLLGAGLLVLLALGVAALRGRLSVAAEALTPMFPAVTLLLIPGILHPTLHPGFVALDLAAAGFFGAWLVKTLRPPAVAPKRWWLPAGVLAALWLLGGLLGGAAVGGDGGDPVGGTAGLTLDVASRYEHPTPLGNQRVGFDVVGEPGSVVELQLRYRDVRWRRPPLSVVLSFDEFLDSSILRDGRPIATGPSLYERARWRIPVLVTVAGERIEVLTDDGRLLASDAAPPGSGTVALQAVAGRATVGAFSYQHAPRGTLGTVALLVRPLRIAAGGWLVATVFAMLLGLLASQERRIEVEAAMRHALLVPALGLGLVDAWIVLGALSPAVTTPLTPAGLHGIALLGIGLPAALAGVWAATAASAGLRGRAVILLASSVAALLAIEGMGRFTDAPHLWQPSWVQYAGEAEQAWWFAPGGVPLSDNLVEDNAFRGVRVPLERAEGERRIVVFGGSQTWGFGMEEPGATYSARLDHLLGDNVRVLNAGFNAGSSFNARVALRGRVLAFEPDLAVFVFGANDNRFYWGDNEVWANDAGDAIGFVDRVRSSSPIVSTLAGGSRVLTGMVALRRRGLDEAGQAALMVRHLTAAIEECRRRSIGVLLVAEPTRDMISEAQLVRAAGVEGEPVLSSEFHRAMRDLSVFSSSPFATVVDRLEDRFAEALFVDSIHFSEEGHVAMAEALRDLLYEAGLAAPPGPTSGE